jgi:hypothetical protein
LHHPQFALFHFLGMRTMMLAYLIKTYRDHLCIYQIHVDELYLLKATETLQTLANFHYCLRFVLPCIDPNAERMEINSINEIKE